jgi:hypothetical protein
MDGTRHRTGYGQRAGRALALAVLVAAAGSASGALAAADAAPWPAQQKGFWPSGALSPENLRKPRPKAAFDLTGTWMVVVDPATGGAATFRPMPKLKPEAQALFDAGRAANAQGKAFHDDTGLCFPAGMPKFMNRVWPIQIMQAPTMVLMIQQLNNQLRWIYLDGRGHADPEIAPPSFNGDSIGRWEGDALVVDTTQFQSARHWMESGVPVSDQLHIVERIRLADGGKEMRVTLTMTDPVNWEGEWVNEKRYRRADDQDIGEVQCLPDLNTHLPATGPEHNVR